MKRPEYSDIPDAFRRAFEGDFGGRRGSSSGGPNEPGDSGENRPYPQNGPPPLWRNRGVWVLGFFFLVFIGFNRALTFYTDYLWFEERGYASVWSTQVFARFTTFIVFFVIAALFLILTWRITMRQASRMTVGYFEGSAPFNNPYMGTVINIAGLLLAFMMASAAATQWEEILLFFNRVSFGISDPVFNRDVSFYIFQFPIYRFLQGWFLPLLIFGMIGIAAIYITRLLPSLQGREIQLKLSDIPQPIRRSIAVVGALFFALLAINYQLNTFDLLFSDRGVVFGAGYTDLNASLYALYIQSAAAAVVAITFLFNFFRYEIRPVIFAGVIWLVATVIVGGIYPAILQQFVVVPNELARERPFIQNNIDFTRRAFGLDKVEERPFGQVDILRQEDLFDNEAALKNVRLWDYRPLLDTYSQLQELRPYYRFNEVDIDRYVINGERRQVMLAPRELDKANLPNSAWVNEKLEFTHGYGLVMNPVDRFTTQGRPEFFMSDLPPTTTVDLVLNQPEIYYGETTDDIVFAGSDLEEFNYPGESENFYSSYAGRGGVPLGGTLKQLAFALRFGETNLLFSQYITPDTRVMFYRNIQERIRTITPFLSLDSDPYIVLADGKLYWIQDAYTTSADYPYSEPITVGNNRRINYIRNSVKVVVDAYHGDVSYYLVTEPETDPIIEAYDQIFPGLFQPLSEMPATLQAHIRYPEDLFQIQTRQYLTYHMTDVQIFFTKEDLREIPQEIFDGNTQSMEPYYVMFRLPGEAETEYLLIQPYTPSGKKNMIAWIAARNDPEDYGQLIAYELPKQSLVVGPIQIEGFIDQEPNISREFSLWDQRGSRIIRGNLIVIPLNDSFLYVEPVYLESETSSLPELKRVIVASGERIIMRETLAEALEGLLDGEGVSVAELDIGEPVDLDAEAGTETGTESQTDGESAAPVLGIDATVLELVQQANAQFEAAQTAQQAGDWAEYGLQIEALEETLRQLELSSAP